MPGAKAIHVVYANWCPHCVPTTTEAVKKAAIEFGLAYQFYDIDTEDAKKGDELVKRYGDWSEDYLIPQVFVEFEGGEFKHVMTGYSEGVEFTRRAVQNLIASEIFAAVRPQILSKKPPQS